MRYILWWSDGILCFEHPLNPPPHTFHKTLCFLTPVFTVICLHVRLPTPPPPPAASKDKETTQLKLSVWKRKQFENSQTVHRAKCQPFFNFFFIILIIVIPATTRRFYSKSGDLNITVQSGGIRFLLSRKFLQQRSAKISLPRWLPCQPFYVLATTGASSITVFCYIIISFFFSMTIQSSSVPFCIWDSPLPQKCKGKVTFENKIIMPKV